MTTRAWTDTPFTRATGVALPIVLAPLAGGPSTPELAAAVSEAGGLGSLGVGYASPSAIRAEVAAVRRLTAKPFAVNLFVDTPVQVSPEQIAAAWRILAPYRRELGLEEGDPPDHFAEPFDEQLAAVLEARVPLVSFTFGAPSRAVTDALHGAGSLVVATVTNVAEARAARDAGADVLCAQGAEAGGHRGTFAGDVATGLVGLAALVPDVADAAGLPVLAAGGIMDGRGVAAALALGAAGAQLGTAFLRCPEAGTSAPYRQALAAADGATVLTSAFSGKPARGLANRMARDLAAATDLPPYPVMNALTRDLRRQAAELGRADFLSLWAGEGVARGRELPAGELVARLVEETDAALAAVGGSR
ncbi:MAG TPA: nitronate monooxygenase [Acidimicrobiales bacterium]|nr:nitronate monooxygenase [Acidimicrobiales bacterium]